MDAVMRQDGVRPLAEVLLRAGQLAEAIDFAASAGVHHGMMAPCDVILEGERTGVTGIGLAQALIKAGIPAEAVSPYGSPQRLAGAPPTRADDIYSLAAITLELLIGTPRDPDQDTSRALREAQGLPERRRVPRPAAHETRLFTMIAGVDAGKLRASFAAAFAEEPSERPSTASEFVARFQDAVSSRRVTDEPAPSVVAAPVVSDEPEVFSEEREDPPSAPVLDVKRTEDEATLEQPSRQERVVAKGRGARRRARRREKSARSQPLIQESHEHERRERKSESRVARPVPSEVEGPEPIDEVALFADVTPPRARSIDEASYAIPVQSGSRALLVAGVVAVSVASFATGFGGGLIVGQRSGPAIESRLATESRDVSHHEPVAAPQPARPAVEDPKPIASPTQPVAPMSKENVSSSAHTIEVSHEGNGTRQQRVTLSERRPARSVDFELRPTSVPAHATAATNSPGSLQVLSRPTGAQVYVDDNLIGTTPMLLSNVAAGSRRLRIELSGYKIWTTSVQIEPSARSRVSARLEP